MGNEHNILAWPAIQTELRASIENVWHGLGWTGNIGAANALVGKPSKKGDLYRHDEPPEFHHETFEITKIAKQIFQDVFVEPALEKIGPADEFEFEYMRLQTWMDMQPGNSLYDPAPPMPHLHRLLKGANARLTLCLIASRFRNSDPSDVPDEEAQLWDRLSVSEIAAIAHMDELSVRNAMSRSGGKSLTSLPKRRGNRRRDREDFTVEADGYEALGWLAGRRYYRAVRLEPAKYQDAIIRCLPHQVGKILGLLVWSNVGTTDIARQQLGWGAGELEGWFKHGPTNEMEKRLQLANLLQLAPDALATAQARRR